MNSSDNEQRRSIPMTGPDPKQRIQDQQFTAISNLITIAARSGSWIFNTVTKEWHSPGEFEAKYTSVPSEKGWYHRFKVMHPIEGLIAADKQIQKILEKRQALLRRVIEYYQPDFTKLK